MIMLTVPLFALLVSATSAFSSVSLAGCQMKLNGTASTIGTVTIQDNPHGFERVITVELKGDPRVITAGDHGFHIHQFAVGGSTTNPFNCYSTGSHYNPDNSPHGAPSDSSFNRHVGDLGNVQAQSSGVIEKTIRDKLVEINGSSHNVIGRSFVLHADRDDLGRGSSASSKTTGNAGARLACCTIGILEEKTGF